MVKIDCNFSSIPKDLLVVVIVVVIVVVVVAVAVVVVLLSLKYGHRIDWSSYRHQSVQQDSTTLQYNWTAVCPLQCRTRHSTYLMTPSCIHSTTERKHTLETSSSCRLVLLVTSSVMWPSDSPRAVSYRWSAMKICDIQPIWGRQSEIVALSGEYK